MIVMRNEIAFMKAMNFMNFTCLLRVLSVGCPELCKACRMPQERCKQLALAKARFGFWRVAQRG